MLEVQERVSGRHRWSVSPKLDVRLPSATLQSKPHSIGTEAQLFGDFGYWHAGLAKAHHRANVISRWGAQTHCDTRILESSGDCASIDTELDTELVNCCALFVSLPHSNHARLT